MKRNILIVDDDEGAQFGLSRYLTKKGYMVESALSLSDAREILPSQRFDAVLLDLTLPDGNGIDWIEELRDSHPGIAIVVITGSGEISVAVESMRLGADNFLTKPVDMGDLDVFLKKSLELGTLRRKDINRRRLDKREKPYFGEGPAVQKIKELTSVACGSDAAVIIEGETGTGKGLLASWIHDHSDRKASSFVEVNCSSLGGELLSSELFGHARGSFTSAVGDKQGLIEVADRGTLFLDEIGDMDMSVQAKFLKVIEEKQYRRIGETRVRRSEFRLICATNHNLLEQVDRGNFRKDLYFRINVFPIQMPALRDRSEDLEGLVRYILDNLGYQDVEISADAMEILESYNWPGNIREVRNVLERAVLLSSGKTIDPEHLPGIKSFPVLKESVDGIGNLEELERLHIKKALVEFSGDVRKAAEALGLSRATLYRKIKEFQ